MIGYTLLHDQTKSNESEPENFFLFRDYSYEVPTEIVSRVPFSRNNQDVVLRNGPRGWEVKIQKMKGWDFVRDQTVTLVSMQTREEHGESAHVGAD